MSISVAIAGVSGYAGGEILRLLLSHPAYLSGKLRIGALCGHSTAGQPVAQVVPNAPQVWGNTIQDIAAENLLGHSVVFLALPHGHSAKLAREIEAASQSTGVAVPVLIDCAADFRLRSEEDWREFYGGDYAGAWPYGIPELPGNRAQLQGASQVAVPGCFPTAVTLGAVPALAQELIEPELNVVAVTGVSGAGKKAAVGLLGAETMGSLRAYSPGGTHRHTPEMVQNLAPFVHGDAELNLSFTPVLAPLVRGILATISAPLAGGVDASQVHKAFADFYKDEPFCLVLPEGIQPETQNVVGSNMVHIQAHVDGRARRLLITVALDNLTKGTAGAAVQCMNLALGLEEAYGLPQAAVAP